MKRYRIVPNETTFYYSTCTIISWIPVFQSEVYFKIIIESLTYCQKNKGLILHGYIIMPTHLHLITSHQQHANFSDIMRDFKHFTSTQIIKTLQEENKIYYLSIFEKAAQKRSVNQNYKVWQDEYHPIALKSGKWFNQKLQYVHANPVRKGFVEKPEAWKYSSARNWLFNDHGIIKITKLDSEYTYGAEAP